MKMTVSVSLVVALMAPVGHGSPKCETFDGLWTSNPDGSGATLREFYINDECTLFTRDESGYWGHFNIGGDFIHHNAYDHPRFSQYIRGTWNKDKTQLMIESFNLIESGFHPAFGNGESHARTEIWRLDEQNKNRLIIETVRIRVIRDSFSIETKRETESYYRVPEFKRR